MDLDADIRFQDGLAADSSTPTKPDVGNGRMLRDDSGMPLQHALGVPPESWAKWPSFARGERVGSAGDADMVERRDFAVKKTYADGRTYWCTDKIAMDDEDDEKRSHRSHVRWSRALKSGMGMITRAQSGLMMMENRGVRRSSVRHMPRLEYPELEILPTEAGFREIRALEGEIELMKGSVKPLTLAEETEGRKNHLSQFFPVMLREAEPKAEDGSAGRSGGSIVIR
jgi:hypothetical protein